jgi:hypothetical protein
LAEDVVHQPERVVSRVAARDRRKAVCDVGLRLVHHRDDDPLATSGGDDRRQKRSRQCHRAPAAEDTRATSWRGPDRRPDENRRQLRGRKAAGVLPRKVRPRQRFDDLDRPLRPAAVRVTAGVQVRHQRFDRANGWIVVVLPDRRNDLALRVAISSSASDGAINMSPSNASTGSKSSDRQVQTIVKLWRVTVTVRLMPRLSSSSAITAAGRDAVPRSMRRDSSQVVPGASSGSKPSLRASPS